MPNEYLSSVNFELDYPIVHEIYNLIEQAYPSVLKAINKDADKLELGTCLLLLKSMYNHLASTKILLELCQVESAGAIVTSLWEKSVMLQFISLDSKKRILIYSNHNTFKKLPWSVKMMVEGIVHSEPVTKQRSIKHMVDVFYLQYSYLCAIKHGNPYTLTFLNRHAQEDSIFYYTNKLFKDDQDIVAYLFLNACTNLFDASLAFSRILCRQEYYINMLEISKIITSKTISTNLKVPAIITTSPKDFDVDFWTYLNELAQRSRPSNPSS